MTAEGEARIERMPLGYFEERLFRSGSAESALASAYLMVGALDIGALGAAFQRVLARHEGLCARYVGEGTEVHKTLRPPPHAELQVHDLRAVPSSTPDGAAAEALRIVETESRRPFDPRGDAPLMRAHLVVSSSDRWILLLTASRVAVDGTALRILTFDLRRAYLAVRAGLPAAPPPRPTAADFVKAERGISETDARDVRDFWWEYVQGAPSTARSLRGRLLPPPSEGSPPCQPGRPRSALFARQITDDEVASALLELTKSGELAAVHVVYAAFGAWLASLVSEEDGVFSAAYDVRPTSMQYAKLVAVAQAEHLVRFRLGGASLRELALSVKSDFERARPHLRFPLVPLAFPAESPCLDVELSFGGTGRLARLDLGDCTGKEIGALSADRLRTPMVDRVVSMKLLRAEIEVHPYAEPGVYVALTVDAAVADEQRAADLTTSFSTLLQRLVQAADVPVRRILGPFAPGSSQ